MYNNSNSWYNQPQASGSGNSSSWVQEAGYQTDRTGFGFKAQSGAAMLASLDDKVADADAKLRDFMAEIDSLETTEESSAADSMTRTTVPGFVSGGHVLPASVTAQSETITAAAEEPLVEPTTNWQHLMDANTKHYYYWNTKTNAVTWTIPPDYTEYLVRHKLYREAIAAGRKTMPATSTDAQKLSAVDTSATKDKEKVVTSEIVETEQSPDPSDQPTEIGPQIPAALRNKLMASSAETITANADPGDNADYTANADLTDNADSLAIIDSTTIHSTTDALAVPASTLNNTSAVKSAETVPSSVELYGEIETVAKPLGGIVGYESDSPSEPEDQTTTVSSKENGSTAPALKSLVAYDDSYYANDDAEVESKEAPAEIAVSTAAATVATAAAASVTSAATPAVTSAAVVGPQLPTYPVDTEQSASADYNMSLYSQQQYSQMYNGNVHAGNGHAYDQYQHYQYAQDIDYGTTNQQGCDVAYATTPQQVYGPQAQTQEAPLVFTGAPPPPPPPVDSADEEDKVQGLSSMEISEFSSVIIDKLHFLDVQMEGLSKLQLLLVQLKTRLDDWQAGGLTKEYLIEKLQEADVLLEVCESDSAPVGWRCNWSRKEKQYYYIHEITEELSWTFPEEDIEAVKKLAAQKESKKNGHSSGRSGTLSHLRQSIEARSVDSDLKALFLQKIVEKCTETSMEEQAVASPGSEKSPLPEKSESTTVDGGELPTEESTSKQSKTKRQHSADPVSSDETHKRKKSKHKHKSDQSDKKQKKHSKHKKGKSLSKKSKHKKHHSRSSSSEEPGEVRPKKKAEFTTSPAPRVTTPDSSPTTKAARQRLSSRIFKLDHSAAKIKKMDRRSPTETKSKTVDRRSPTESRSTKIDRRSPTEPLSTKIDRRSPIDFKSTKVESRGSTKSKLEKMEQRSPSIVQLCSSSSGDNFIAASNDIRKSSSPQAPDESLFEEETKTPPPPPSESFSPGSQAIDTLKGYGSPDEMDISSESSRETTPQPARFTGPAATVDESSATNPTGGTVEGHIATDDDMESFLQSIQRDLHADSSSPASSVPLSHSYLQSQELCPPGTEPELCPPGTEQELCPPGTEPAVPSKPPEQYSKAAAPVFYNAPAATFYEAAPSAFYQAAAEKPLVVAHNPVLYSVPTQPEPAVPNIPVGSEELSPIRFPEVSKSTERVPEASKPNKDKPKHKKSSKKSNKMPAALVQKWQKVQSEISTDIEKEERLKSELFK